MLGMQKYFVRGINGGLIP